MPAIDLTQPLQPEDYPLLRDLFTTEQVPPERMAQLLEQNPGFARFLEETRRK